MSALSRPHAAQAVPTFDMAAHLAERDTPELAAMLLTEYGYRAQDIDACVDAAVLIARTGIRAAASDHPIALAIGRARDLAASAVVMAGAAQLTGLLS